MWHRPLSPANADLATAPRCDKHSCLLVRVCTDTSSSERGDETGPGFTQELGPEVHAWADLKCSVKGMSTPQEDWTGALGPGSALRALNSITGNSVSARRVEVLHWRLQKVAA